MAAITRNSAGSIITFQPTGKRYDFQKLSTTRINTMTVWIKMSIHSNISCKWEQVLYWRALITELSFVCLMTRCQQIWHSNITYIIVTNSSAARSLMMWNQYEFLSRLCWWTDSSNVLYQSVYSSLVHEVGFRSHLIILILACFCSACFYNDHISSVSVTW